MFYQNQVNNFARGVHIALMGDPTLRLHPVAPPSNLNGTLDGTGGHLSWTASSQAVLGYHIYRAAIPAGPFSRVSTALVTTNSFTDPSISSGPCTYMVRAVELEITPSGSYYNPSQGIFLTLSNSSAAPAIRVTVSQEAAGMKVTWNSEPGKNYRVLSRSNFMDNTWSELSGPITATGTTSSWTDAATTSGPTRFYCVVAE